MSDVISAGAGVYEVPEELRDFRELVRRLAQEQIAPARRRDRRAAASTPGTSASCSPSTTSSACRSPTEYGGTGTGTLMLQIAVEEIAKACASSALILMIQELGTLPIQLFGSDELKQRLLPQLRQRRVVAGLRALRARGRLRPGGDADHRRPRRRRVGDQRRRRTGSPTPAIADFYVVFAVTDRENRRITAFVVEKDRARLLDRRQARAQARDQGLADRLAGPSRTSASRTRT